MKNTMKKLTAFLLCAAMLAPSCMIPRTVHAAAVLGDEAYATLAKVGVANDCNSTQGIAVNDNYVYSAQIKSSDESRAVVHRIDRTTGESVLMTDGSTGLTYFTNLGHANAMDLTVVNGVEYLCVLTNYKISLFAISGTTLNFYAEYYITHNGSVIGPSAISVYKTSGTTITFLTKGGTTVSMGSVDISNKSGDIPVTIQCTLDYSKILIDGTYQDFSSFVNQGMGCAGNYIFVPITGNHVVETLAHSLILGYDISKATGSNILQPDPDKIFYIVSEDYPALFEVEDVDITSDGKLYFNTNGRLTTSDTKHDGVFYLKDYTFGSTAPVPNTAPVLGDDAYTELVKTYGANNCTGSQGLAVSDDYVYSAQIKSDDDSRAIINRVDKKTGAATLMTDSTTGLTYFTNLSHANAMDWARIDGVEYLYILTAAKIVVLEISGTTLKPYAEYDLKYNGNKFSPSAISLYQVDDTYLTFLFKWKTTISYGTIPITATSGNISVTIKGYANNTQIPANGTYMDLSSWLNQGMGCVGDMLYVVITGNHADETINHSFVLGYDLTKFTGNNFVQPETDHIFYIVSDNYPGLFEIEDVDFDKEGKMYFHTNGWLVKYGSNHDAVCVMNDFLAEVPPPANTVPILGDDAYTLITKVGEANDCYSTQGFTAGGRYLYSAQAGSGDVYTVVHRVHRDTGEHVLMKDGATGLTYFDTLGHANDMDFAKIGGVEYLFVLGAYRILVYRIEGDTLYHHATYNLYAHGNAFAPAGMTIKEITDTHITFLFKWQTTISTASVALSTTSTDLHVSILFYAEYDAVPLDGKTKDLSGFSNQGFFYKDGHIFSVLAGASKTETINRSVILGYNIENVASYASIYPEEDLVFYILSEDYPGLFEIESCSIADNGRLYFNTNSRLSSTDTKHDGVFVMNDFRFGGVTLTGRITSVDPGKETVIRLLQNGAVKQSLTLPAQEGSGEISLEFEIPSIAPGTYDVQITKEGHLPCTITGVPLDDSVDLTGLLANMPLATGDVNGDGLVELKDLILLTSENSFNRTAANAESPAADINGDEIIDLKDLVLLTSSANFNKGPTIIAYTP